MKAIKTINDYLSTLNYGNITTFDQVAELHNNGQDTYPATFDQGSEQWQRISLTDGQQLMAFHLLISTEMVEDSDTFGKKKMPQHTLDMIIAFEREVYDPDDLSGILLGFPDEAKTGSVITHLIEIDEIEHDHDEIINDLFGESGNDYTDHKSDFKLARITYNVKSVC